MTSIRKKSATRSYLDVESLFTNISIEGAVQAALRKLENESDLANRRNLTPTLIADNMNLVLRSTYFQYNGSIYEQQDGAAMTSSVSAVIASIYMEEYEEQAKANATCKPKIWKRYVDDTFTFLESNSQQPTICFTMNIERDNTIPFSPQTSHKGLRQSSHYRFLQKAHPY